MKWLCKLFSHKVECVGSTLFYDIELTKRHWKCKRCGETFDEDIWHDIE